MYVKHLKRHLPSMSLINEHDDKEKLPLKLFAEQISNWWSCAQRGVEFLYEWSHIRPVELKSPGVSSADFFGLQACFGTVSCH